MSDPTRPDPADLAPEFDALMRRNGLSVTPAQRDKLLPGYADLRAAVERLRGRPHTAEPSNVFALRPMARPSGDRA